MTGSDTSQTTWLADLTADRPTIALTILSILFVLLMNLTPINSTDYFIHLAVAEATLRNSEIPRTVLFAFSQARDFEFVAHEWLSALALWGLHNLFGIGGMAVVKAFLSLTIFALSVGLAFQVSRNWPVSVAIGCLVMLTINFRLIMRPEIFAYVFLLASLNLIQGFLRTKRVAWLAALPPVILLWANFHGSFVLGLLLPPAFLTGIILNDVARKRILDREDRNRQLKDIYLPLVIASLISLGASLINPFGIKMLLHTLSMSQNVTYRDLIIEWLPAFSPSLRGMLFFQAYLAFIAVSSVALIAGWRKIDFCLLILLIAFGYLPLVSNRHIAIFALAGTYWLARGLGDLCTQGRSRYYFSVSTSGILILGIALLLTFGNMRGSTPGFNMRTQMPQDAIETLRDAGVRGNVINSYAFGGPLAHYFYPDVRIGIDSRLDAYGTRYYWEYMYRIHGDVAALVSYMEENDVVALVLKHSDFYSGSDRDMTQKFAELRAAGFERIYDEHKLVILAKTGP